MSFKLSCFANFSFYAKKRTTTSLPIQFTINNFQLMSSNQKQNSFQLLMLTIEKCMLDAFIQIYFHSLRAIALYITAAESDL